MPDAEDVSPLPRRSAAASDRDDVRAQIVEGFGDLFDALGTPRMQGRVLGYLILSNAPQVSTRELRESLDASGGSISAATRGLTEPGFIRRVFVKGSRSHYFRAEEDVWGTFLATEHRYVGKRRAFAEDALSALGPDDARPRKRLINMRDYFTWLEQHHHEMHNQWEEFKKRRDAEAGDED